MGRGNHLPKAFCAINSSISTCAGEGVNHREGGTTTYCKAFGLGRVHGWSESMSTSAPP